MSSSLSSDSKCSGHFLLYREGLFLGDLLIDKCRTWKSNLLPKLLVGFSVIVFGPLDTAGSHVMVRRSLQRDCAIDPSRRLM